MDRRASAPRDGDEDQSTLVVLGRYSGHGLTIAVATGLFLLLGWWVDGRLGSTPFFTVIGALVGAGAGFYSMLQHVLFRPRAAALGEREEPKPEHRDGGTDGGDP